MLTPLTRRSGVWIEPDNYTQPTVFYAIYSDLDGVTKTQFKISKALISAANVSTAQTYSLPATGGTLALSTEVGGTRFIDGGNASSVYTAEQILDGGDSSSF